MLEKLLKKEGIQKLTRNELKKVNAGNICPETSANYGIIGYFAYPFGFGVSCLKEVLLS